MNKVKKLFVVCVVVPTVLALIYYGMIASDIYVSESRYMVRKPEGSSIASSLGVGLLMQGGGMSGTQGDTFAVADFMVSRDAVRMLDEELDVRSRYSVDHIDMFGRYPRFWESHSQEQFFQYLHPYIGLFVDSASSIVTLTVRSYSAEDAYVINDRLLTMGETFVNRINERARRDLIDFARKELAVAERASMDAVQALEDFRQTTGVLDPEKQSELQLSSVVALQKTLSESRAQLAMLEKFSAGHPRIELLNKQIEWLQGEIEAKMSALTSDVDSMSQHSSDYQRLMMNLEFSKNRLTIALSTLEEARREAQKKQIYLERIVQPHRPDVAVEPKRLSGILTTILLGVIAWGCLTLVTVSAAEHLE